MSTQPASSSDSSAATASGRDQAGVGSMLRANMTLAVLFVVAVVNIIDRKIIIILQEPLKREFGLSDAQLGTLTGFAFAVVYCTLALPFARVADQWIRIRVVAITLVVWSVLTAASGFATSFLMMVFLRMGVAAGEAGSAPASHSMISDLFPPDRRVSAFALWSLAVPVGTMLGYGGGGLLYEAVGWRGAMIAVGICGILLAPLVLLFREPRRGAFDGAAIEKAPIPPFLEVLALFWKRRPLRYLLLGASTQSFVLSGIMIWSAPFYIRVFGMSVGDISFYLAIIVGASGGLGVLLGGRLARWLGAEDRRWYMWVSAIGLTLAAPLTLAQFMATSSSLSLVIGALNFVALNLSIPCLVAQAHHLVLPTMRATASAALMFGTSVVGLGVAPPVLGFASDMAIAYAGAGELSLRYAMLIAVPVALLSAYFLYRSAQTISDDLRPSG